MRIKHRWSNTGRTKLVLGRIECARRHIGANITPHALFHDVIQSFFTIDIAVMIIYDLLINYDYLIHCDHFTIDIAVMIILLIVIALLRLL